MDVCSKFIVGVPLKNKSEEECTTALMQIKAVYAWQNRLIKKLVFDHEPGILPIENVLMEHGIELILKAAG